MLEKVVQAREGVDLLAAGQTFLQDAQVLRAVHLAVNFAVEREDGAADAAEPVRDVQGEEIPHVGGAALGPDGLEVLQQRRRERGIPELGRAPGDGVIVEPGQHVAIGIRDRFGIASLRERPAVLLQQEVLSGHHAAREADDEIRFSLCRQHQGDGAAFAVAEDADPVETLPEERDAGQRVILQVFRGHEDQVAGRFAEAAVVVAQRRESLARKRVRDDCKGLVFIDFLVAVLEPAPGHHQQDGGLARAAFRQGQRSAEDGVAVAEIDFFGPVGEWSGRSLGTVAHRLAGGQGEREGNAVLVEGADDVAVEKDAFERGVDAGDGDLDADQLALQRRGDPLGALVRRIKRAGVVVQVEHQRQRVSVNIQFSRPGAGLRRGRQGCGERNQKDKYSLHGRAKIKKDILLSGLILIPMLNSISNPEKSF